MATVPEVVDSSKWQRMYDTYVADRHGLKRPVAWSVGAATLVRHNRGPYGPLLAIADALHRLYDGRPRRAHEGDAVRRSPSAGP